MSCYIVDNETIDRIVNFLAAAQLWRGPHGWQIGQEMRRAFDDLPNSADGSDWAKFGQRLLDMNERAYYERYGEWVNPGPYRFVCNPSCSLIQAYKSIQCLLYQCTEGDLPESRLFQALGKIQNAIASVILEDMAEYEAAIWG